MSPEERSLQKLIARFWSRENPKTVDETMRAYERLARAVGTYPEAHKFTLLLLVLRGYVAALEREREIHRDLRKRADEARAEVCRWEKLIETAKGML